MWGSGVFVYFYVFIFALSSSLRAKETELGIAKQDRLQSYWGCLIKCFILSGSQIESPSAKWEITLKVRHRKPTEGKEKNLFIRGK